MNKSELAGLSSKKIPYKTIAFWTSIERPGVGPFVLSNFYKSPFKANIDEKNDYTFSCVEQYMMFEKARLFQDAERMKQILALRNVHPKQYKQLGRKVKPFDPDVWNVVSLKVVKKALMMKFEQNPRLKAYLLQTGNAVLVEDSPFDQIWGAGIKKSDSRYAYPEQWPGENRLGFLLMEVRDELRGE